MLPHLGFDIQVEIIKLLPVKSVIQFRSVCKAWKSLIDSPQFIAGYNLNQDRWMLRYSVGFRQEKKEKYVSFVDDDRFPQQKFALIVPPLAQAPTTILGSSHGLLCVYGSFQEQRPGDSIRKLPRTGIAIFWNPAIRKSIVVFVPNNKVVGRRFNYVVGFGVVPDTKDPMLVRITYIYDFSKIESTSCIPFQVMVFTLSSGAWTTSSCTDLPRKSIEFTYHHTVVGQFIYWLALDRTVVDGGCTYYNLIMSFNMSTQEFREVQLPDSLSKSSSLALTISRIRESLAVIEDTKGVCGVWIMEDSDSKAFTKLFTINAPVLGLLGFRKSGEPILKMRNGNKVYDTTLALYEPCSEHIKDLGIRGNGYSFAVNNYTESLLLLDHEDGRIIRCGTDYSKVLIVALNCTPS